MKFLILFILVACASSPSKTPIKDAEVILAPIVVEVAPSVMEFSVAIKDTNYYDYQKTKLKDAIKHLENIFNSKDYKAEILKRKLTSTKGKSNLEVFEHLMKGKEDLSKEANQQLDLTVEMYNKKFSKVIGYTTPSSLIVYTNRKFHDNYDACDVASNLGHEWTHKMGYDHLSASDWTSVPYTHSTLIRLLCPLSVQGKLTRR